MPDDSLHRFLIENINVRGEWVHLDETWQQLLDCAEYPDRVKKVLGEALVATMLLSATLKYQGTLSLQVNGDGAINLLLIQATSEGTVRGLARWTREPTSDNLKDLFGGGNLVITIEPSNGGERYQGIVGLQEDTLAQALAVYFEQSEQLKTRLWLATGEQAAAGLLLQRLPKAETTDEDGWNRALQLSETVTAEELLELDAETLLYRLFNEEQVRLFDAEAMRFSCSCSQAKIESMVHSLGRSEADSIIEEQGAIAVDCEFCSRHYQLDDIDVQRIFSGHIGQAENTVH